MLDLRAGTLTRDVDWSSPAGARIKVTSVRLVSLTQRAVAAISYTVEPVDRDLRLVLQSELVANEEMPTRGDDPRLAAVLEAPLVSEEHQTHDGTPARACWCTAPGPAGCAMAAGDGPRDRLPRRRWRDRTESYPDLGRFTVATGRAGRALHDRQVPRLRLVQPAVPARAIDQVVGALAGAH